MYFSSFDTDSKATCNWGQEIQTPSHLIVVAEKLKSEKLDFYWLAEVKGGDGIGFIQLLLHQVDPRAVVLECAGHLELL